MLIAEPISVPEHSSSPIIRLFSSLLSIIFLNSLISTANVDNPLNILSFDKIRVNIRVNGLYIYSLHGTKNPHCAIITHIPNAFIREDLPTALVPNNRIPFLLSLSLSPPSDISCATYISSLLICSIRG